MRQYKIEYTREAIYQLNYIYCYIKNNLSNPIAAKNFYIQFIQKLQTLKFFPFAFCFYKDTNFRFLPYKQWLILYKVKNNIVEIQTIISSK